MGPNETPKRKPLRLNVLFLIGFGYFLVLVVFCGLMIAADENANDAYSVIEAPLMALIGGSLALAKDILKADDDHHGEDDPPEDD